MQEVRLFTTLTNLNVEDFINSMCELDDEDFNGNNGDEFTSELALQNGFTSDQLYTVHELLERYGEEEPNTTVLTNIMYDYCNAMFKDFNYYTGYTADLMVVNTMVFVSVAYTIGE